MRRLRSWVVRLFGMFQRERQEHDFAEEMESHLTMHIDDNLRAGMNPEEARRQALIKLGGIDRTLEEYRDRQGFRLLVEMQRNFGYASRILWKQKGLSLIVVGLLAFASAANTTIFSVYNFLRLRSIPYPDSDRVVYIGTSGGYLGYDPESFYRYRTENRSFEAIGSFNPDDRNYSRNGEARTVNILVVTHDFASVFRFQPVLGRGFLERDESPGEPEVVMLGNGFWQREFGGSTSAIGQTLNLDGRVHTVVGVLPSNADFPEPADMWVLFQKGTGYTFRGFARLKDGVSLEQARKDLNRIHKSILETRPMSDSLYPPKLQPFRERLFGGAGLIITILLLASGILLLIVCFNIAGMMLARSEARSQEIGIRTALGASRGEIMRQLLTESLLLALPGVLLGLLTGQALLKLSFLKLDAPSWVKLTPDIPVLLFCVILTAAATLLFGLAPALQASRVDVQHSLHEANPSSSASSAERRGLKMLVVGEIAFAVILLVGAGLLLRTWQKMMAVDPGFRAEKVFTFNLKLPPTRYADGNNASRFFQQLLENIRQIPGVIAASGSSVLPMGGVNTLAFEAEGTASHPGATTDRLILMRTILPDYFKTMGIPLLSGRDFNSEDGRTKDTYAVIVDQSFSRLYWPNSNPISKRIRTRPGSDGRAGEWMTIVGLAHDVSQLGLDRSIEPGVYIPHNQWQWSHLFILVRSAGDPEAIIGPARLSLHSLDPDIAIFSPMTMTEVVRKSTLFRRMLSTTMMLFGVAALLIAAAGVYGLVNFTVSQRTHEIGIRMALGATRGQVLKTVVGGGIRLMIGGALLGTAGSVAACYALRSMLFGVTTFDAPTYFAVGAILLAMVFIATLMPARRASRIDPMRALRSE